MALWRAIFRRRFQKFVVTEKRRKATAMGLRRIWPQAALVAISIVAVSWATSRAVFGISEDYFGLLIGTGLASYHSWLALTVMGRATTQRDPTEQWHHPLCLAVDYSIAGEVKPGVSVEFNENGTRLLTWEPLEVDTPLRLAFHSPVGETVCHGRVTATTPVGGRQPFGYVSNVLFHHADPLQRARDVDAIRRIILRYVVPVVTMTHRVIRQEGRSLPEEIERRGRYSIVDRDRHGYAEHGEPEIDCAVDERPRLSRRVGNALSDRQRRTGDLEHAAGPHPHGDCGSRRGYDACGSCAGPPARVRLARQFGGGRDHGQTKALGLDAQPDRRADANPPAVLAPHHDAAGRRLPPCSRHCVHLRPGPLCRHPDGLRRPAADGASRA